MDDLNKLGADAKAAAVGEATTIWAKLVGLFNRFWPILLAGAVGYVLGAMHALGWVF